MLSRADKILNMGTKPLTVAELKRRQREAGWFLPPESEGDPDEPPQYDPTLSVRDNERLAYDYFLNCLRTVPGHPTTMDAPILQELAEAHILYLRCKDKFDTYELGEITTKKETLRGILKWAHSRRQHAYSQLGYEPAKRKAIKNDQLPPHTKAFREGKSPNIEDNEADLFDISEIELAAADAKVSLKEENNGTPGN